MALVQLRSILILTAVIATAACDDGLGPQAWNDSPDTIALYSASRTDLLGYPAAYDFINLTPVRIENSGTAGNWDVALAGLGSALQLLPAAAFAGQSSRAGIATISGTTFENLAEAPADTALYSAAGVTLTAGGVYVVRTRRAACSFSTAVHYAKVKAVTVDAARGLATLAVVRNPYCNDRSFVPPDK